MSISDRSFQDCSGSQNQGGDIEVSLERHRRVVSRDKVARQTQRRKQRRKFISKILFLYAAQQNKERWLSKKKLSFARHDATKVKLPTFFAFVET